MSINESLRKLDQLSTVDTNNLSISQRRLVNDLDIKLELLAKQAAALVKNLKKRN